MPQQFVIFLECDLSLSRTRELSDRSELLHDISKELLETNQLCSNPGISENNLSFFRGHALQRHNQRAAGLDHCAVVLLGVGHMYLV